VSLYIINVHKYNANYLYNAMVRREETKERELEGNLEKGEGTSKEGGTGQTAGLLFH